MNKINTKPKFLIDSLQWIRSHRTLSLCVAGALLVLVAGITTYAALNQKPAEVKPAPIAKPAPKPEAPKYYSPLTGLLVDNEAATKQAVTAIMIENSPDARPQSGLKQSGMVYEAVAEGGITRFLTLHQKDKPQIIGPVRSIRPYYVDWLAPYSASVAHVGGSPAALDEVRNGNYRDIDQFFNSSAYWRSTDRYAPHNVYTSFERLDALNSQKGFNESVFTGFSRVDGKPSEVPDATSVTINISSALYNTTYAYDKASNSYLRSQAGGPHLDREDGQIAPSVVIAMKVARDPSMEDGHHETIATIGSGEAIIFQNGTAQTVTWTKKDKVSQITFSDATGKDVPLVRGQTWITAVPGTGDVSWK
ncbi:putative lipoprotein YerB precursor [compost metagenome]